MCVFDLYSKTVSPRVATPSHSLPIAIAEATRLAPHSSSMSRPPFLHYYYVWEFSENHSFLCRSFNFCPWRQHWSSPTLAVGAATTIVAWVYTSAFGCLIKSEPLKITLLAINNSGTNKFKRLINLTGPNNSWRVLERQSHVEDNR